MSVTSRSSISCISELEQAAIACGLSAVIVPDRSDPTTASLIIDGSELSMTLIERAHPNPADLALMVEQADGRAIVIADRISDAGRDVLRRHGWGWLDRRGHLRVWQPGIRIEAPFSGVHSLLQQPRRHESTDAPGPPIVHGNVSAASGQLSQQGGSILGRERAR